MPSMLARARQRAEDERLPVEWLEQDCRDIRSDKRFALVFSATNAMPEELLRLCRLAGLDVAQRYGDYDQSLFTSTSPKQFLFCHSIRRVGTGHASELSQHRIPGNMPVRRPHER